MSEAISGFSQAPSDSTAARPYQKTTRRSPQLTSHRTSRISLRSSALAGAVLKCGQVLVGWIVGDFGIQYVFAAVALVGGLDTAVRELKPRAGW
jgi:hypothetical protein